VEAAHAAWLLVQHAPPDLQEECLPLLEDAVSRDDASRRDLANLMDRVLMFRGQPQVYGTQYLEKDGILTLWTVQEPGGLDQRHAALGLEPEAQNRTRLLAAGRAAGTDRDQPPAEVGGVPPGVPAPGAGCPRGAAGTHCHQPRRIDLSLIRDASGQLVR
jgi:hypothetical protein